MLAIRPPSLPTLRPHPGRLALHQLSRARPSLRQYSAVPARRVQPVLRNAVHTRDFATSPSPSQANTSPSTDMTSFYDLKAELPNGKTYDFSQLKGKVVLIVNTASKWCVRQRVALTHNS